MGAYFNGPFSNFDFLDRFSHPFALPQCRRMVDYCVGTYQLWFGVVGCETGMAHWDGGRGWGRGLAVKKC